MPTNFRGFVQIHRRPVKCNNITNQLLTAKKLSDLKANEKMRAFRYINIGKPTPSTIDNEVTVYRKVWKCIKCPATKLFSPAKYQDGVVIDLPQLVSCSGYRIPSFQYTIETFFSPITKINLSEGSHTFIGRIKNVKTNEVERVCNLRFKVKVKRCPKFTATDENLKIFCDAGNVWGSKCKFSCKNHGILSHNRPIYCNDDLQWSDNPPFCKTLRPSMKSYMSYL